MNTTDDIYVELKGKVDEKLFDAVIFKLSAADALVQELKNTSPKSHTIAISRYERGSNRTEK